MQITVDLPDDAFALLAARAKKESRSMGNIIVDLVQRSKPSQQRREQVPQVITGERFPVVDGHRITPHDLEQMLDEDASV